MPPSPLLSARMMNTMYLIATILISAQTISDKTPYTLLVVGSNPCSGLKHSWSA